MSELDTTLSPLDRGPVTSLDDELVRLEVEDALMQIEGVESARVVPGAKRIIDELHALVSLDRDPKHVARDLQTLLLTRFGIEVDRRVVSVVRLGSKVGEDLGISMPRLGLDCVSVSVRADGTTVSVELSTADDEVVTGTAGPIVGDAVVSGTAQATAHALQQRLDDATVRVLDARIVDAGGQRVVLVVVEASNANQREVLSGSALVRRAESDSVARAVLDATNRIAR